jgi:hypothetical protein
MNNSLYRAIDIVVILLLIGIMIFFVNPLFLWMPSGAEIAVVSVFGVAFSLFVAFFWRERPQDEREADHSRSAGKTAFIIGTSILAFGIIYESLMHNLSIWLPLALAGMMLSKMIALFYLRSKK